MTAADRTRVTFRLDCGRMFCSGILESAATTFLLLIAVKHLALGPLAKGLVASGSSIGLLLSPLAVSWAAKRKLPTTLLAARILLGGATCCSLMAAIDSAWVYIPAAMFGMAANWAIVPLMTHVYQENYPGDRRGRLYAMSIMLRIIGAMGCGWAAGRLLDWKTTAYPVVLLGFAAAFAVAALLVRRIPSRPLPDAAGAHPLHALHFVREDRVFRQTLVVWMFMGFANLMMIPMRVEYLGNPRYGLTRSAIQIALLTTVIPNLARLVMNPVWGWLFDRVNFFVLRMTLNLGFAIGIFALFTSDSQVGLILGAITFGVSSAGGDVAWGLWVTKFAPPGRVADYMSVHTFFTGIRGVLAPVTAFQMVQHYSPPTLGWFSAGLIVTATLLLLPEVSRWKGTREQEVATEEVVD